MDLHKQSPPASNPQSQPPAAYLARYRLSSGLLTTGRLAVLGACVVLAGMFFLISGENRTAFSPGQLTNAHSLFDNECSQCHQSVWHSVPDSACQECHEGPVHHDNQAFTPSCAACHLEHRGRDTVLVALGEKFCTNCHADLEDSAKTRPPFVSEIRSFTRGHPEFAVSLAPNNQQDHQQDYQQKRQQNGQPTPLRIRLSDTAQLRDPSHIKLNHTVHLQPDLPSPQGFEQLDCESCHRLDQQGAYTLPIRYETHCMRCHTLEFDPRFPKQPVPHAEPATIHTFLVGKFAQYFLDRQKETQGTQEIQSTQDTQDTHAESIQQIKKALTSVRRRPDHAYTPALPKPILKRVQRGVQEAERLLFNGLTCRTCHTLQYPPDNNLPTLVPTAIPERWLLHSVFDHQAHVHTGRSCESCHTTARTSQETHEVLLPGITVCQECHSQHLGV
jgi:predicted CXXCH cytochrome family protein